MKNKNGIITDFLLLLTTPVAVYLLLIIFSNLHWNWFWFCGLLIVSAVLSILKENKNKRSAAEAYLFGMRYIINRFKTPNPLVPTFDEFLLEPEEENTWEQAYDNDLYQFYSSLVTEEELSTFFPRDIEKREKSKNIYNSY